MISVDEEETKCNTFVKRERCFMLKSVFVFFFQGFSYGAERCGQMQ